MPLPFSTANDVVAFKCPGKESDPRLGNFITATEIYISSNYFGDKFTYAQGLLICHWLMLEARGGGSDETSGSGEVGAVTSKKEGDLQIQFSGMGNMWNQSNGYLAQTTHGQELLMLYNTCILNPITRFVSVR